ncbi:MAG: gliding motility-associated C-terminal domain-containing protein [Saprospiraceae bacterium]|nr:gliding motility-associated C-terminal domain-containing protein [Saprospiraceae bacterium]
MKRNYCHLACISRQSLIALLLVPFFATPLSWLNLPALQAQTIWLEDFSGANQGWSDANFTDCDMTAGSFNGVQNGRYEVIDMEGAPCCPAGGGNDNEWITNPIDINGACNVGISVSYGSIGTFECTPGGPFYGCTGNVAIDNGHDQIHAEYRIDGGAWVQFGYLCGGGAGTFTAAGLTGNTLEIRIRLANKAAAETYWFDNVLVTGDVPLVNPPADLPLCGGQTGTVTFTGSAGATFSWTNDNTAIGLGASGSGNISFPAANVTATETATITVTPSQGGCDGPPVTFMITVNPGPVMDDPANENVCSGDDVMVVFTSTGNPVFNWTNSNPAIGLPASGTGDLDFTAANVASVQTGTITITPVEAPCTGPAQSFTITVNPLPNVNQPVNITVCGGITIMQNFTGTPGATFSWTNDNPAIGLPAAGTGGLNFPSATVTMQEVATITVTPMLGICSGIPRTYTITVNPTPVVNDLTNIAACNGEQVEITIDGTPGATFNWTNNNPNIGLASLGSGNIDFVATSPSGSQSGTIVVTPILGTCPGTPEIFTVTVSASPTVNPVSDVLGCIGQTINVPFSGTPGATYNWVNLNPSIGLAASGSSNPINFVATGNGTAQVVVTPSFGGCPGSQETFTITITPGASMNAPANQAACAGDTISVVFSAPSGSPTYSWTNSNPLIGLAVAGTGNINFTGLAPGGTQTATITVTPQSGICSGIPQTFTITVSSSPTLATVPDQSGCTGDTITVNFNTSPGSTVNWTNNNPITGLPASGNGNISFTATGSGVSTVTATPTLGTCTGPTISFNLLMLTSPTVSIGGDLALCAGQSTTLLASGGNAYQWQGGPATPAYPIAPDTSTSYTVTVTSVNGCSSSSTVLVDVTPQLQATISGTDTICAGNNTTLVASGGSLYFWNTGLTVDSNTVAPLVNTMYSVIVSDLTSCPDTASILVVVNQPDTIQLNNLTCNPNNAGTFTQILTNQFGCDSTVVTVITFDPAAVDTTLLNGTTCIPAQAGTSQTLLTGADGCDSLVISVITLLPSDTVLFSATTCNPNNAGTFTQNLTNQFGCDSTVITTITFDPANIDTTLLTGTTCNPAQVGTTQTLLTSSDGCDSLVISTITLLPSDTVSLSTTTCDPTNTGSFVQVLTNMFGCDSTVITTVTFDPTLIDTTLLSGTTCDPTQAGTSQTLLAGSDGCDSLVINIVTLLPSDVVTLSATTCDPTQSGTFIQNLTNQFGCDSTVVTTVTLLPSDMTSLSSTTCDPTQAGTFTQNLFNQFGCDSTVITTVSLLLSDTINLFQSTCDPTQAGSFVQNLTNQFGCDSVIITLVAFDPVACAPTAQLTGTPPSCGGASNGSFTLTITGGQVPIQYAWSGGSDTIAALNMPTTETGLTSGSYIITLTDAIGLSTTLPFTLAVLPGLNVTVNAVNIHNGFTLACADDVNGTVGSVVSGGTAPYNYLWNTGGTASTLTGIGAGMYSVTISDVNGCTGSGNAEATAPPALALEVVVDVPMCGDETLGGQATFSGGVPPLNVFVNNQQQSGNNLALGDGSNTVSVQDANGCIYDTIIAVNLPPVPQVVLPPDAVVVLGETISVEALINIASYDTLIWSPLPDPACAGCPVQEFQPFENLTLTAILVDTTGCEATDEMRIVVEQRADIYVPNVFSPNDDGLEDIFLVNAGSSVVELQEVAIFDRWGDKLYLWDNPLPPNEWPGWDGKTADKDVNPGVFVYYLKIKLADGTTKVIDGDVTLVR